MNKHPVNIEDNWNVKWKAILQKEDGSIDVEQLKKELADFEDLIHRMESLTHYITNGRLSYCTYPVATIKQVHEECLEEEKDWQKQEDLENGYCHACGQELTDEHYDEVANND